jgi:hypothetical protein
MSVVVTRDGGRVSPTLPNENEAFVWLLRHQGQSVDYATRYGGYAIVPLPEMDERDTASLAELQAGLDKREHPDVGDFVIFTRQAYRIKRISHRWTWGSRDDDGPGVQTSAEHDGSYHLGHGGEHGAYVSYSGGLDPTIPEKSLYGGREKRAGRVWIWHHGIPKGHNGVDTLANFRVWYTDEDDPGWTATSEAKRG